MTTGPETGQTILTSRFAPTRPGRPGPAGFASVGHEFLRAFMGPVAGKRRRQLSDQSPKKFRKAEGCKFGTLTW
jgi:hypothetical protein